ncbi:MAG TPA: thioredoxin family protein [Saprospiraceae bacterium]|nr:thioredoxin family protein [Saprospiraceae bacterium]MCB9327945.1 thioredoxin family protein [Lewinellaceae bacterium]HPQ20812.1 thioredoxin family protein [Saprospiraceae bacterium]HRX28553.1 thioredoxin family protein [Saprospiraceae bacterium]
MKQIFLMLFVFLNMGIYSQEWQVNMDEAKKVAAEKNLPIVMVFEGSDWCAPCRKLEKQIWNSEYFKSVSPEHFVMLKVDFPRRPKNQLSETQKIHNAALAEKYNSQGIFPQVVILNNDKVVGRLGYENISPEEYVKKMESFL